MNESSLQTNKIFKLLQRSPNHKVPLVIVTSGLRLIFTSKTIVIRPECLSCRCNPYNRLPYGDGLHGGI